MSKSDWTIQDSTELYGVNRWGDGYFQINKDGHLEVIPEGAEGPQLDLNVLMQNLCDRGIRPPILIRFPDIARQRIETLVSCFNRSIEEYEYQGEYRGVYPIKVNQQRHLVEEVVEYGRPFKLGLECGSKPELLVALAMLDTPDSLLVCNGFKDAEYIETALLSKKLGRNTIIVVDRYAELPMIIDASKKLNIKPLIGFRSKLASRSGGKWAESSGARSKFGLTAAEMVRGVQLLKDNGMLDCLELLHFHIGSQIPSIQQIKSAIKEAARFFTELHAMGAELKYLDVGGGLSVDYDGSGLSDSSTNYSEQEYTNDVVSIIQSFCDEKAVPHPHIVSEMDVERGIPASYGMVQR